MYIIFNTHYLLVFNSAKTIRAIYSCIFYFVDKIIASREIFTDLFPFQLLIECDRNLSDL